MKNEDLHEDLLSPDQSDRATAMEELRRRAALEKRKPEGPPPTGLCHWCCEFVGAEKRWCDQHCRDDWEKEQARIRA